ncbi:ribosomal RNA small subunit methyltransferase H [Clostridia bacterium]|nr:ribosomal RNA small subunit methyltransferase H [Clostridia bacterium]
MLPEEDNTKEYYHRSVLFEETIRYLTEKAPKNGVFVDGTLGGGGHSDGICSYLDEKGLLLGIDRDLDAIRAAEAALACHKCKKLFVHDNFSNLKDILKDRGEESADGIILDLGVSSYQLDNAERGFSYMADAPLDMRMDEGSEGITAEYVVNNYSKDDLCRIIKSYGEERWASRISAFIEKRRKEAPIRSTGELVNIIKAAIPAAARRDGPHPAKRTFQAIRIEVNEELYSLEMSLDDLISCLKPGGRLCVITFHSLEDRIVKDAFARHENPCTCPKSLPMCVCGKVADGMRVTKKPIRPGTEELECNPRSRSAKLRVFERAMK